MPRRFGGKEGGEGGGEGGRRREEEGMWCVWCDRCFGRMTRLSFRLFFVSLFSLFFSCLWDR